MSQSPHAPKAASANDTQAEQVSTSELIEQRKAKLQKRVDSGQIAYPNQFRRDAYAGDLQAKFEAMDKAALAEAEPVAVSIAGRVMLKRVMGKASFITVQDMSGRLQCYVSKNDLGEEDYAEFKTWDLGDIVGISGTLFRTNTGELSVHALKAELLTKSIRPLPDKFHGLSDTEARYRARHLDLMTNEATRKTFEVRAKTINFIRKYLTDARFVEVETPMMHVIPGGASARPFVTHHNALDMPLYLRIAPELYLKRLVVGGIERVFEINRNFRNEGVSTRHNPEFTMIEFYQAFSDYKDLMDLSEDMLGKLAIEVTGSAVVSYQGQDIDFGNFTRTPMIDAVAQALGVSAEELKTREQLAVIMADKVRPAKDTEGWGKLLTELFEELVENTLIQPTFITDYPAETSPLARRSDDNPELTDRFELFVGGREIANGFSELNDPVDQAARFAAQVAAIDAGDDEAMHYDAEYIEALEYGLPPTAGEGIGIDRLVMLLTDAPSIRDVILFPHMRIKN